MKSTDSTEVPDNFYQTILNPEQFLLLIIYVLFWLKVGIKKKYDEQSDGKPITGFDIMVYSMELKMYWN